MSVSVVAGGGAGGRNEMNYNPCCLVSTISSGKEADYFYVDMIHWCSRGMGRPTAIALCIALQYFEVRKN